MNAPPHWIRPRRPGSIQRITTCRRARFTVNCVRVMCLQVGHLALQTVDTPGHCDGHLSFHMSGGERNYLIGGDLVFWGGRVLLQNIHDCRITDYAESLFKVVDLDFDALIPGHLQISLRYGKEQVEKAAHAFRQLGVPPNIL